MKRDLISQSMRAPVCLFLVAGLSVVALPSSGWADSSSPSSQAQPSGSAAGDSAATGTLRVCASANQAPFSEKGGSGFENKIAEVVADSMGRKVDFVWTEKPAIYLVRDYLDKKACDVVVGLDSGDPRVLTTKPYYRAGYVFITKASDNLDIHSWKDPRLKTVDHIAVGFDTPGEMMLKQIGKYDDEFNYEKSLINFKSSRNQYVQIPPEKLVSEVADGHAKVAVGFSPEVARYVHDSSVPLKMTPVDDDTVMTNGQRIPETFDQSMGMRKGDAKLLADLDAALVKAKPQIAKILKAEGIPPAGS